MYPCISWVVHIEMPESLVHPPRVLVPYPLRRRIARRGFLTVLLIGVAVVFGACGPTISTFNARAYEQATSLKVEARALMDNATEPYADHVDAVRQLKMDLRKARAFARGRPNNEISARQWSLLIDPERNLLGGFLNDWKKRSSLPAAFVKEKKAQVSEAFDTIIELESGKITAEEAGISP